RVGKLGNFPIKVRANNGVTYNTRVTIEAAEKGEVIREEPKKEVKTQGKAVPKSDAGANRKPRDEPTLAGRAEQALLHSIEAVVRAQVRSDVFNEKWNDALAKDLIDPALQKERGRVILDAASAPHIFAARTAQLKAALQLELSLVTWISSVR